MTWMVALPVLSALIVIVVPLTVTAATPGSLLAASIVPSPDLVTVTVCVAPFAPNTVTLEELGLADPFAFAIVHALAVEPTYLPMPVMISV